MFPNAVFTTFTDVAPVEAVSSSPLSAERLCPALKVSAFAMPTHRTLSSRLVKVSAGQNVEPFFPVIRLPAILFPVEQQHAQARAGH